MPFPKAPFQSEIQTATSLVTSVWQQWLDRVQGILNSVTGSGKTTDRPTQDLYVGMPFFDTDLNQPVYWNGSSWITSGTSGTVTSVTATAPVVSSGGNAPVISMAQSSASANGYLSSTDWSTFNGKLDPSIKPSYSGTIYTGSVSRLVTDMFGDYLSVLDFGADPTAVADSTSAIQAAIAAAALAPSGKKIYFPAGYYKITATLTVPDGIGLYGDSFWASKIIQYTSGITTFDCSAGFASIDGLQIAHSVSSPSPGSTAIISGANSTFRNFLIWGCDIGIQVNGAAVSMSDFQIWNYTRIGIYFSNTNDCNINNFIMNASVGIPSTGMGQLGGIRLYSSSGQVCEGLKASNGGILNGVHSLTADAASYTIRQQPEFCHFTNVFFDVGDATDGTSAMDIQRSANLRFTECYFFGKTSGALIQNSNDISFDNCIFYGCSQDGAYIGTNTAFVSFTGCTFENNQRAGIYFDSSYNFNITGGQAYPLGGYSQQYGVYINGACNNFTIVNFNAAGNSVRNIYDLTSASTAKTIYGCLGAITQTTAPGYIVSALSKTSGVTYTNTKSYPIFVSVWASGGTDSVANIISLTVGSVAVSVSSYKLGGLATVCGFVPPGNTYIVGLYGAGNAVNTWTES